MALKGTLKDFGIADIFQLISHQSKTGVLHLASKDQEVRILFSSGDVVRAESATRNKKDLIGAMLVRAEVIGDAQLEQSLGIQKRTLKRLGDILVEHGFISRGDLREFAHLQTTETVYKLFNWETGTYVFETEDVSYDPATVDPIRSENVLMEGFRMVDEWPMIRKKIGSYGMTFVKAKEFDTGEPADAKPAGEADEVDDAFNEMLSEDKPKKKRPKSIGANEEKVFGLIVDDRDVQKLIDLSRLGEFETCKSLYNLLSEGYLKIGASKEADKSKAGDKPGGLKRSFPFGRVLVQAGMYLFLILLFIFLYMVFDLDPLSLLQERSTRSFQDPVARELVDRVQLSRVKAALELYRMEAGRYPDKLSDLVEVDLLSADDVRFPWRQERLYDPTNDRVVILRPFE
jgi:hypothetical protein